MFKILIIDDDENDRLMVGRALRRNGIPADAVRYAKSGNEAIAYFKGEGPFADRDQFPFPTIVLTDLKMANGDGFEVLDYLKNKHHTKIIPVLVLSGAADADDVKRSYAMGGELFHSEAHPPC